MSGYQKDYTMADDKIYSKYGKIVTMMDDLQTSGCFESTYSQPVFRLVVTGPNGSGKDSFINCLFGCPFLPPNCRSKRQMEIRFVHSIEDVSPMVEIEEVRKKFTRFAECSKFVADLQNATNDSNQNMSIRMNLTSNMSGDFYVISTCEQDAGNPHDKTLLREALAPSSNFIILVLDAKTLDDSQLQIRDKWFNLIKNYDPELERTMVVFTKCDILPSNFNYNKFKIFLKDTNEIFSPKFGFVCVKANFAAHIEASDQTRIEREYFCNHKQFQFYNTNDFFTFDVVAEKIIKWIYGTKEFKKNLENAYNKLLDRSKFVDSELQKFGSEFLDFTSQSKDLYLQSMMNVFCETVEKIFSGKCEIEEYNLSNTKLNRIYTDFLCAYLDFKPSTTYKNKEIIEIIQRSEGSTLSGFPSGDVIYALLDKKFEDLRNELNDYLDNIYTTVNQLFKNIINRYFARFPKALSSIEELIISYLDQEFNKSKKLQNDIAEMNFIYIYVDENSDQYKALMQNNLLKKGFNNNNQNNFNNQNNPNNPNNNLNDSFPFKENKDISFFKANKDKDSYYNGLSEYVKSIVDFIYAEMIRSLREYIPKSTRNFFIKSLKSNMRFYLLQYLSKNPEFCQELEEDQEVAQKRKYYIEAQKKLKRIHKLIDADVKITEIIKGDNIKSIDTILQSQGINTQNSNPVEEAGAHSSKNLGLKTTKTMSNNLFGVPPKMDNNKPAPNNATVIQNKAPISQTAKNNLFGNPTTESSSKTTIGKKPPKNNLFGNPGTTTSKPNNLFGNQNTKKTTAANNLFGTGTPNQGANRTNNLFGNPNANKPQQQQQQQNKNVNINLKLDGNGNITGANLAGNIDPKDAYNFYQKNKQYMPSGQQMLSGAKAVNNFMNANNNNNNNNNQKNTLANLFGTKK